MLVGLVVLLLGYRASPATRPIFRRVALAGTLILLTIVFATVAFCLYGWHVQSRLSAADFVGTWQVHRSTVVEFSDSKRAQIILNSDGTMRIENLQTILVDRRRGSRDTRLNAAGRWKYNSDFPGVGLSFDSPATDFGGFWFIVNYSGSRLSLYNDDPDVYESLTEFRRKDMR